MMITVDAHELERVQFIPHVSCIEIQDGMCHVDSDGPDDIEPFPVSDLIAIVEEEDY